jgi:hypothetical protein
MESISFKNSLNIANPFKKKSWPGIEMHISGILGGWKNQGRQG